MFVFHHTNCHVIESDRTLTTRIIPSRRSRRPNPEFIEIVAALWPERDDWHSLACADAMGWYVALYTRDMLNARDEGVIAEAYRVSMRDVESEELRALVTDVANRSGYAL